MNEKIKTYRDLLIWQKSMQFVAKIYKTTKKFPADELYSLTNQIKRSSISIPSNIAEGFGRNSQREFKRFLQIAIGSLFELQTQLEIASNLEYLENQIFLQLYEDSREIERMISSLIHKIK